jgi:tRNA-dihydrouridine synthase C
MEGVIDSRMRETLTNIGGYELCMTEFVRVTDRLLPAKVFRRLCPELASGGRTRSGTPVVVQLLGGEPEAMAANAARAAVLGALGIDLNFGCPSRFVNRSAGGAVLLKDPQRVHDVVKAVRAAVPREIPVSAKLRLGYDNTDLALDNARAVEAAGAAFVTVHARTRADGYKAPARWEWLARVNEALQIPVVANGDINSLEDYLRCREVSGCEDVMIGRGAVACPDLARRIKHHQQDLPCVPLTWDDVRGLLTDMADALQENTRSRHIAELVKQWLLYLRREYAEAGDCFDRIRRLSCYHEMVPLLKG